MQLSDLLDRDRIAVPLDVSNLADAADVLAELLTRTGVVSDEEAFRELVSSTLPREMVTVGDAFLLHVRMGTVRHIAAALGVAPQPIKRHRDSEQQARIVLLLVAPPRDSTAHLTALSAFARAIGRPEVVERLLAAESPDDVLNVEPLGEHPIRGQLAVRDVMVPRRLSVQPDTPLGEASRMMVAHRVDAMPVVSDASEVLGLVTHGVLLKHLLPAYLKREAGGADGQRAQGIADPHAIPVRDVMDRSVLCISEDQSLADVANMMITRNIERFPVVREGQLVGLLTRGEIVRRLFGR
jgi:CBS domain-containing protein